VFFDAARAAAARAEEALGRGGAGEPLHGPLHGLPIAVKDLFHISGHTTSAGSRVWIDRRSDQTAAAVALVNRGGAIILGKTHTVELGLGTTGVNQHLGTPRNPWRWAEHHAPGGSSSGSAVAVAAGASPWSLGTDTGGSVRIPAAWCGVVGFKPSFGQISLAGVVPLSPTLDSVGFITRSVGDAGLLYSALRPGEPLAPPIAGRARLARLPEHELCAAEPAVLRAYEDALRVFSELGVEVIDVPLPRRLQEYDERNSTITMFEAARQYGRLAADPRAPLDDRVRSCIEAGSRMTIEEYGAACRELPRLRVEFERSLAAVDGLVTPTTQHVAPRLVDIENSPPPNAFTRFVNLLGACAIAVPCGFCPGGLPCSLQIICKAGAERELLRIAAAFEAATPWHRARPPEPGARPAERGSNTSCGWSA
jgi:aspartyl-tRNA(Asn)/glutamyl-tRNA(Gln) amidotransferase subunit A